MPTLDEGLRELRALIETSRQRLQTLAANGAPSEADADETAWLTMQLRGQERLLAQYESEQRWPSDL